MSGLCKSCVGVSVNAPKLLFCNISELGIGLHA
ncbi:unnamed protein product [Schistosoma curassoni]|uniref:Uncharacterized protein n=1 Tax=Schistosoma curassoni TaxID=6186 RepID=A0A183JM56_9TREM|nr:unnamed protein product [Schistosoma curassoni]